MQWSLLILYLNIGLYALCSQLQKPVEPFLVQDLVGKSKGSANAYGLLQSVAGFFQLVGAPFMGPVLDRFGADVGCQIVFLASALSYGLLACSTSLWILYLSKVPTACQHAFLVAQTLVAKSTTEEQRGHALGLLMTALTIGASIGLLLGGIIGKIGGVYVGAWLAMWGSLLSAFLAALPAVLPVLARWRQKRRRDWQGGANRDDMSGSAREVMCSGQQDQDENEENEVEELQRQQQQQEKLHKELQLSFKEGAQRVVQNRAVVVVLCMKLLLSIMTALFFEAACTLIMQGCTDPSEPCGTETFVDGFRMDSAALGLAMAARSACSALSGCILIGPLTRMYGPRHLVTLCLLWMTIFFGGLVGVSPQGLKVLLSRDPQGFTPIPFVVLTVLCNVAAFAMATALTTLSTTYVEATLKGTVVGFEHGVFSLSRVGVPSLGVLCLQRFGSGGLALICCIFMATMLASWVAYGAPLLVEADLKSRRDSEDDQELANPETFNLAEVHVAADPEGS